jgi:hypothetical protein
MNKKLILEEIEKGIEYQIFEVARSRPPELKNIESLLNQIRRLKYGSKERIVLIKELSKEVSKFSGVKRVSIGTKKNFLNAMIVTNYNNLLPDLFKKKIKPEEANRYIKSFHIIIGDKMYDNFTDKELTAVILHELGHIYQHTSTMGQVLPKILKIATSSIIPLGPLLIITFAISRTLTFKEHISELDADDYAAKYGYADEMAKVITKFNKISSGSLEKNPSTWLGKILNVIRKFFTYSTHPTDPDRICSLINRMKNDYKEKYPKLSKEISTIYADIRC